MTHGRPGNSPSWSSNWGQPRGDVGVTQEQSILFYPQVAPGSPLGCLHVSPGSLPCHPGLPLGLTEQQSCTVQQAFFSLAFFFCEMDYSSVICNNTLVYIRGYGRSAGVRKAGLGQQGLGGASRGTTNSKRSCSSVDIHSECDGKNAVKQMQIRETH